MSQPQDSSPTPKELARDFGGPLLIGAYLSIFLYGLLLKSFEVYWKTPNQDSRLVRIVVTWSMVLSTLEIVLIAIDGYMRTAGIFGDTDALFEPYFASVIVTGLVAASQVTMQGFFAWRLWLLTGWWPVTLAFWIVAVAQLGIAIWCTNRGAALGFKLLYETRPEVMAWEIMTPVTDLLLAGLLIFHLQRRRTTVESTKALLNRISLFTLQTGLITAVWTSVALALFLTYANNMTYILQYPLSILYLLCLMSSINARNNWAQSARTNRSTFAFSLKSSLQFRTGTRSEVANGIHVHHDIPLQTSDSGGGDDSTARGDLESGGELHIMDGSSRHHTLSEPELDAAEDKPKTGDDDLVFATTKPESRFN